MARYHIQFKEAGLSYYMRPCFKNSNIATKPVRDSTKVPPIFWSHEVKDHRSIVNIELGLDLHLRHHCWLFLYQCLLIRSPSPHFMNFWATLYSIDKSACPDPNRKGQSEGIAVCGLKPTPVKPFECPSRDRQHLRVVP